jgi:hypothetical protein
MSLKSIKPAKSAFGTLNQVTYQSDYIINKKSKQIIRTETKKQTLAN